MRSRGDGQQVRSWHRLGIGGGTEHSGAQGAGGLMGTLCIFTGVAAWTFVCQKAPNSIFKIIQFCAYNLCLYKPDFWKTILPKEGE